MGLRSLACWNCGFESHRGHGCLSVVSVVCCQVEVLATGWPLVQRGPTECGLPECDRETSIMRLGPTGGCCAMGKKNKLMKQSSCWDATSHPPTMYFNPITALSYLLQTWGVHSENFRSNSSFPSIKNHGRLLFFLSQTLFKGRVAQSV
jgi:hypothetical protein